MSNNLFSIKALYITVLLFLVGSVQSLAIPWSPDSWQESKTTQTNFTLDSEVFTGNFYLTPVSEYNSSDFFSPQGDDCLFTSGYGTGSAPVGGCETVVFSTCNFAGEYFTMNNAVAGTSYTFMSNVSTDYMTVRSGSSGGTVVASGPQPLTVTAPANGSLYVHVAANENCGSQSSCRTTSVVCESCAGPTDYCAVTSTNTSYGIDGFVTTGGVDNISNTGTGPGQYTDYTSMFVSAGEGDTVNFVITGLSTSQGYGIWVDWGEDFCFNDTGDQVFNSAGYVNNPTGTITVPAGTPAGDYRMRVVGNWLSSSPTSCGDLGSSAYGEAEDYTFRVLGEGATYCEPTYTSTIDYLSLVSTDGALSDITYTNSTPVIHDDQTGMVLQAIAGNSFDVNTAYVGGAQTIGIWVDWDNNGNFGDADERIFLNYAASPQSTVLTVPSGVAEGEYRMRVRGSWSNHESDGDDFACNVKSFGSSVDFTLAVVAGSPGGDDCEQDFYFAPVYNDADYTNGAGNSNGNIVANDIVVAAGETFTLETLTFDNIYIGGAPTNFTVQLYEDNGSGGVGAVYGPQYAFSSGQYTANSRGQIWSGYPGYEIIIDLSAEGIVLDNSAGTSDVYYWIGVSQDLSTTGNFGYWLSYPSAGANGSSPTWQYLASTQTWGQYNSPDSFEGAMKVEGICGGDGGGTGSCENPNIEINQDIRDACIANFTQDGLAQSYKPLYSEAAGAGIKLDASTTGLNVTLSLWDGLPNAGGNMLATGTSQTDGTEWVDVFWSSTVNVTVGNTYYIVIEGDSSLPCISGSLNNPYPDGMVFANDYGSWPDFDYTFRTYSCDTPAAGPCDSKIVMDCGVQYTAHLIPNAGEWVNYTGVTYNYTGSEQVFEFTAPDTGVYQFEVSQGTADADFMVMDACSNTAGNVLGSGYWTGLGNETLSMTAGDTIYIIADLYSYANSGTTVSLKVNCPSGPPPTGDCPIEYEGDFEDGLGNLATGIILAADFPVPAGETWNLDTATFELLYSVTSIDVSFYEDAGGQPGAQIHAPTTLTPTSQNPIGQTSNGTDIYATEVDLSGLGVSLPGGATYWVAIETVAPGGLSYWHFADNTANNGTYVFYSTDYNSWTDASTAGFSVDTAFTLCIGDGDGPEPGDCVQDFYVTEDPISGAGYSGGNWVANDIIVEGDTQFKIQELKFETVVINGEPTEFDLEIFEDNGSTGVGASTGITLHIDSSNMTFTPNGFLFGVYPQFTVTVTVPDIILQANGNNDTRYWLAVSSELSTTGDFAYWVSYEHVYTPDMDSAPTWQYLASAGSWEEYDSSGPNEGYMKVSGECDTLGLGDISSFDFAYYPNPVSDVLNIKSQKAVQSVEVFNLAGQNVLAQKQLSANGQINVDALSPGVYVFKVTLEGGQVETFKIIKK